MQIPTKAPANSLPPIPAFVGTADIRSYEIEEGDDVLNQDPELSAQEMYVRLAAVPWLGMRLEGDYPGRTDSPYINGCAAMGRVVMTAAALDCDNARTLAGVLGLSEVFVLVILFFLVRSDWRDMLLPEMRQIIEDPSGNPCQLRDLIAEFFPHGSKTEPYRCPQGHWVVSVELMGGYNPHSLP
jgi:hypothetical protein